MTEPPITRRQQSLGFSRGLPPAAAPPSQEARQALELRDARDQLAAATHRIDVLERALQAVKHIAEPYGRTSRR